MCVIALAAAGSAGYRLVVAANRDEFHRRPAAAAGFWPEHPQLLAGRDLQAGGTWMGITRDGRFAALTNLRGVPPPCADAPSRGALVASWLLREDPERWLAGSRAGFARHAGFNLVYGRVAPALDLHLVSNDGHAHALGAAPLAISNAAHGTDWPKTRRLSGAIAQALGAAATADAEAEDALVGRLFAALADDAVPQDRDLPDSGLDLETERRLAPIFVRGADYGTRASTVLLVRADGCARWIERRFDAASQAVGDSEFRLRVG